MHVSFIHKPCTTINDAMIIRCAIKWIALKYQQAAAIMLDLSAVLQDHFRVLLPLVHGTGTRSII